MPSFYSKKKLLSAAGAAGGHQRGERREREHRSGDTPCGYVRNIGREGQEAVTLTLSELQDAQVDMFTTVFVGNSQTKLINGKLVTPRGYKNV